MKEKEIKIALYPSEWEQIANACIYIADYIETLKGYEIPNDVKETLRKTYFTIKAHTR